MADYSKLNAGEKGRINGINAAKLRRNYDPQTLRRMAAAYDLALQYQETGDPQGLAMKKAREKNNLAEVEVSFYQAWLAYRIARCNEFGGLPRQNPPQPLAVPLEQPRNQPLEQIAQQGELNLGI
jgi:hypothetical protein